MHVTQDIQLLYENNGKQEKKKNQEARKQN